MRMGDSGGIDGGHQLEIETEAPPKSPWKTAAAASPAMGADPDSWPALSGSQQRPKFTGNVDSNSGNSPPPPAPPEAGGCGDRDPPSPAPQVTAEQPKFHGRGNFKPHRRVHTLNHNKTTSKQGPNNVPPCAVPVPHYLPTINPVFHNMVPIPPTSPTGYVYQLAPRPFPRADAQPVKFGSDHAQAFVSPASGQDSSSVGRRRSTNEEYSQMSPSWNNRQPTVSNHFHLQQTMGQRPFMSPPIYGPTGFVDGQNYQGPPVFYYPAAPPGFVRLPYPSFVAPYPLSPGVPMPPSPTISLQARIVKQIEYYFSDENLQTDVFLKHLMDYQGWVPISRIADFKKVKQLNAEISFILDALLSSKTIEVQGDKIRRRNEWSKYISQPLLSDSAPLIENSVNDDVHNENKGNRLNETAELPISSLEHQPLTSDIKKNNDIEEREKSDAQVVGLRNSCSSMELGCHPKNGDNISEPYNECLDVKNLDGSSNDLSSTFILDEELELEQKMIGHDHPSSAGR